MFCSTPGGANPQIAGKSRGLPMNDLASMYRFLDNDKIPVSAMREARAQVVLESMPTDSEVLIVHDVTLLDYSRHNSKQDRRPIGDHGGMGYEYVPSLAVDFESGDVIGVLHDTLVDDKGPDDQDDYDYDYEPSFADFSPKEKKRLKENHRHQMAVRINALAPLLVGRKAVHVADREFDDIFLLDRCVENQADFVIRSSALRNVQVPRYDWLDEKAITSKQAGHPLEEDHVYAGMDQLVKTVPLRPYKNLPLDSQGRVVDNNKAKRFARLSVGAFCLVLYRDAKRNKRYAKTPRPVTVNVVVIRECHPPKGAKPVFWVLLTSLPVETLEQQVRIGRMYELRWRVEAFFKLLKSGYKIEKTRFDSGRKTAKLLVVLSLAAMIVLKLKRQLGLAHEGKVDDKNYKKIKHAMQNLNDPEIPVKLRLFAYMVKLGGWLGRKNDPIGPTIIMRGLMEILAVLDAMEKYKPLLEQAKNQPQILSKLFCV